MFSSNSCSSRLVFPPVRKLDAVSVVPKLREAAADAADAAEAWPLRLALFVWLMTAVTVAAVFAGRIKSKLLPRSPARNDA